MNAAHRPFVFTQAPTAQPWPGSVDGARALVEGYYSLKRQKELPTQVGVGGLAQWGSVTSPTSPADAKNKKDRR